MRAQNIYGNPHSPKMACSAKPHATRPIQYKNWSSKDLELSCKAVSIGLSIRRAAEEYQIPKSTIQDHVSGKVVSSANSGQQKYLTDEEEEELVEFLLGSAKIGYPQT